MVGAVLHGMVYGACMRECATGRFTVAALAFSPFLKQAMASKRIWRGGVELGFWMALGERLACAKTPSLLRSFPRRDSLAPRFMLCRGSQLYGVHLCLARLSDPG